MNYLTKEDILKFQRELALENGGFFSVSKDNISNRDALDYLLEAPLSTIFGQELYPGIFKKAACYAFFIIKDHIFYDGNKRTGIKSALLFLELNGFTLEDEIKNDDIVNLALAIAENRLNLDQIAEFFETNSTEFIL